MNIKILWPGKTRNQAFRNIQADYLKKITRMSRCRLIETSEARGIDEKNVEKIKAIEAAGLEKQLKDDYIICLLDKGREMNSEQFARFLEKTSHATPFPMTFIIGGFLGLADRIVQRADCMISLSRMTFSHELARIILLEQIYRALSMLSGGLYAK